MRSRFLRSAGRSGWHGLVLLALLPVAAGSFCTALETHGTVRSVSGDVYCFAAVAVVLLGWQISSAGRRA